jgi:hypothetical protein
MQNETLRGTSPAAARGAAARDVRLCVACLHENRHGEPSCEACGTSLFLILCPACEAANGADAQQCHACGASLGTAADDQPTVIVTPAAASHTNPERTEASKEPEPAPIASRMSLVRIVANGMHAAPPATMSFGRLALLLAGVAVTTAGVTYHFSTRTAKADGAPQGKVVEAPKSVASPSVTPPRADPKAGASSVTHTKPADAGQAPAPAVATRAAVVEVAPVKSVEPLARVPAPRPAPRATVPADASPASVGFAPQAGSPHAPVTHTRRPDAGQAAPAAAVPVTAPAAAVVVAAPAAAQKSEPGCDEAVTALGLCNRAKSGGK